MSGDQTEGGAGAGLIPGAFSATLHEFPEEALARWKTLDESQEVRLRWAKSDVDHLYFAIQKIAYGVSHTQAAVLHLSNKRKGDAQRSFDLGSDELINGVNHLIDFMSSVMAQSLEADRDGQ